MVTGYPTVGTAVDALKRGAAHYLSKPIRLEELRATVREIVDKKRHLQMRRGPTLCFAGPPGSGRTSAGLAIAEALDRKFVRLSLAGLRDEAELRGQRRTHAGARPGRIIAELKRLEVGNPVFMLDEIDKIGPDFQGDPARVLMEILDSEQNAHFLDHYLEVPFDLSGAMFIATANVVEKLPAPLLDSLEVIHFPGYTEDEKLNIARKYLIPGQLREHALHQLGLAVQRRRHLKDHPGLYPGGGPQEPGAGDHRASAASCPASAWRTRGNPAPSRWTRLMWQNFWGPGNSSRKWPRRATRSGWPPGWYGPNWAGSSSSWKPPA